MSNIQSVVKYESKLLVRSWFFRVFTTLAVTIITFFNFQLSVPKDSGGFWIATAIPSNIPYLILLLPDTGQAIIAIFLAFGFLKRDKKLDTSEVFYVRPLSGAEYIIGKIWGNLRVFLLLNLVIMATTATSNLTLGEVSQIAYLLYFLLASVPTLILTIGLVILLILILKNQVLTFVLLLGHIGLTAFYIGDKFYYLLDYIAYNLLLVKSSIIDFFNQGVILNHRGIYFPAGLAFAFLTISLFRRLPDSLHSNYPWLVISFCTPMLVFVYDYWYIHSILYQSDMRATYTKISNQYVSTPKIFIHGYDLSIEQHLEDFLSEIIAKRVVLDLSVVFTLCLSPGLTIHPTHSIGRQLKFKRDKQIVLVDFDAKCAKGGTISATFRYDGQINNSFYYLDIPPEVLQTSSKKFLFNIDRQYSFQMKDYLMLTSETHWYPRTGTNYSDKNPDWQQTYFSNYRLKVGPPPGLVPLSQGKGKCNGEGVYLFKRDYSSQTLSLAIGDYQQKSAYADSILYSAWCLGDHDHFIASFNSTHDAIPWLMYNVKEQLAWQYKLDYPFKRFSIVEVPV